MTNEIQSLTAILLLATLVEMIVEYFLKPWIPTPQAHPTPWIAWLQARPWDRYCAAAVAVTLATLYNLDLLSALIPTVPHSIAGVVLTGLVIARGSNYTHDLLGKQK